MRDRLLQVDVLAGLARPHRHERVPVVRRRDGHRVDVVAGQQFAVVDDRHRVRAQLDRLGLGRFEDVPVDITERGDLDARQFGELVQVIVPATPQSDDADAELLVRTRGAGCAGRRPGSPQWWWRRQRRRSRGIRGG